MLNVLMVIIGCVLCLIGMRGLISIWLSKRYTVTYGNGLDKHLLQSGPNISHGMVVDSNGKLLATSRTVDGIK